MGTLTKIDVRVMAVGGKFLGDDIGGALITITDARTGELLAKGNTKGGSGEKELMEISITRTDTWPVNDASVFTAALNIDQPILLQVSAYGPLAAPQAANTTTTSQWLYPGRDITGGKNGGGLFLEIHGLAVQALNPPTHYKPATAPKHVEIKANVTMMCGCPISVKNTPWYYKEFEVIAEITKVGNNSKTEKLPLVFDKNAPLGAPSQFSAQWQVPPNRAKQPEIYQILISAFQEKTGNTGIDYTTIIIPPKTKPPNT